MLLLLVYSTINVCVFLSFYTLSEYGLVVVIAVAVAAGAVVGAVVVPVAVAVAVAGGVGAALFLPIVACHCL